MKQLIKKLYKRVAVWASIFLGIINISYLFPKIASIFMIIAIFFITLKDIIVYLFTFPKRIEEKIKDKVIGVK